MLYFEQKRYEQILFDLQYLKVILFIFLIFSLDS
jgi:hypothetical protein